MSYSGAPTSVRSLEQRIRNLEGDDGLALRRRVGTVADGASPTTGPTHVLQYAASAA